MKIQKLIYVVVSLLLFTVNSVADDISLDFEGLKNMEQVQNFYNGGAGSEGSTKGLDYNITFSANTLALIDSDAGGSGNFANEPSPDTIFFFTGNDTNIYMNVEGGFTEGFSFSYTSIHEEGDVEVWTDYNGTGKKIGSLHLDITPSLGKGDPNGEYDNWVKKSLSFDGRAKSIVFKGVANQIGFDNISLNPNSTKELFNHEFSLDKITHMAKSNIANTFSIYFKNLKAKNGAKLKEICDYDFFVEDTKQNKVNGNALKGKCEINEAEKAFKINFKISEAPYNLENAKVTICKGTKCKEITDIKDFSVYGTNFDVTKDGFSFENAEWNKYMFIQNKTKMFVPCFIHPIDGCTETQISYIGKMHKLVDALKYFLPKSKIENAEKDLIGYYDSDNNKYFGGVCHGLAVSAIANFNNKSEDNSWGNDLNSSKTKNEIISIFQNHWNNRDSESAKPFSKYVHNYDIDDFEDAIQALGKITYYYTSQSVFNGGKAWVGKHKLKELNNISTMNAYHENFLKLNKVSLFSFDIKEKDKIEGHSIIATQLIKYNNISTYVLHDNNFPNFFSMLSFAGDYFRGVYFRFEKDKLHSLLRRHNFTENQIKDWFKKNTKDTKRYYWDYTLFFPYGQYAFGFDTFGKETDYLHIYGKVNNANKMKRMNKRVVSQKKVNINETIDYPYPNHITITIVGGKLLKITDIKTKNEVILNPIVGKLKQDKAYLKDNMLITKFLLPKNSVYKIELQKYKQYPAFEVYVKIPTDDGKVEIINYENLATNQDDTTSAHFLVGNGNTDKAVKRDRESNVVATYDESIDMKLTPILILNAVVVNNSVNLSWNNPINPNYKESVVVRKENSKPTSITDGTEIYRGSDEEFIDTTIENNKKYYYAVYAISKDGNPTQPEIVFVDTYKYTLYGTATDEDGNSIEGATVTLYNGKKTKVIDTTYTSKTGLFAFNNLLDGEYVVSFSHPTFKFENSELNVTVENKSKEVLVKGEGVARLAMDIPQVVKVGETQNIVWDGIHIVDSATVDIKLLHNKKWETVASNVPYGKHVYKWKPKNSDNNATLKVSIDDKIYSEKKIIVLKNDKIMSNDNNVTNIDKNSTIPAGGGGGCSYNPQAKSFDAIMMFMLLFSLLYPFRNLFNIRKR